jgi:Asp-tRNA(Asn)/Glu-tRNA(Gln) amidotransferase A subunit family amidase
VERETWTRGLDGHTMRAVDYARSVAVMHRAGRAVARFFADYDVLLTPTMCQPPYPLGVLDMSSSDRDAFLDAVLSSIGFTSLFNSAGNPAVSLPLHRSSAGLPIGIQFAGRFGDEATLFRLAGQLEGAHPWSHHRPGGR